MGKSVVVAVYTGTKDYSGSDGDMSIALTGDAGTSSFQILNPLKGGEIFEEGDIDTFSYALKDSDTIGDRLKSITLKMHKRYASSDNWYVDVITIQYNGEAYVAYINQWIDEVGEKRTYALKNFINRKHFLVVSDLHFGDAKDTPQKFKEMTNKMMTYINKNVNIYNGVITCGDNYNKSDGNNKYFGQFRDCYFKDLTRKTGLYAYEGHGNHDGQILRDAIRERNEQEGRTRPGLRKVEGNNKYHYSWQWRSFYFIQLGAYPGFTKNQKDTYYYNPFDSMNFLQSELNAIDKMNPRPTIVLLFHLNLDSKEFPENDRRLLMSLIKTYGIRYVIYGHIHILPETNNLAAKDLEDRISWVYDCIFFNAACGNPGNQSADKGNYTQFFDFKMADPTENQTYGELLLTGYGDYKNTYELDTPIRLSDVTL